MHGGGAFPGATAHTRWLRLRLRLLPPHQRCLPLPLPSSVPRPCACACACAGGGPGGVVAVQRCQHQLQVIEGSGGVLGFRLTRPRVTAMWGNGGGAQV